MGTFTAKPETVVQDWYLVDATDKVLGRLATQIATRLRGKHKPEYTPHVDTGDHIVIVNAAKIRVTGDKMNQKKYYRHTGYPGGIKETVLSDELENNPERVIERASQKLTGKDNVSEAACLCRSRPLPSGTAAKGTGILGINKE